MEIRRCIISEEELADDASSTLKHIRKSIVTTNDKIHTQLMGMVNSHRTYLQDAVITMRNNRVICAGGTTMTEHASLGIKP